MPGPLPSVSRHQLDRAGKRLRDWWREPEAPEPSDTDFDLLFALRGQFPKPLMNVTVGLRQFVQREAPGRPKVAQRLKRLPSILDKLVREPSMALSRMEDLGGCRAILPSRAEIDRIVRRMRKNSWDIKRFRDYIATPPRTGYRGIHIVVVRFGQLIEVQLRTPTQHEWAEAVERAVVQTGYADLKNGRGPADLLQYFERAAYMLAEREAGREIDDAFRIDFNRLREAVLPYFRRADYEEGSSGVRVG